MEETVPAEVTGIVVIARNEGDRLRRCLASLGGCGNRIVYVDSGSTDGSPEWARSHGVEVIPLDMSRPFTAARARNEGFRRLMQEAPGLRFVQFIDGDCEISPGWLDTAARFLDARVDVACVAGRLHERHPERSIYNRLCDIEWNRPAGLTDAVGGIMMVRAASFDAVGGFRDDLIAGEEPELCLRLRSAGSNVWRLADDMAWHDAAMTRFTQWWRRALRGGYALAEGTALHGRHARASYRAKLAKVLAWGLVVPIVIAALAMVDPRLWLLAAIYPVRIGRLSSRAPQGADANWLWAGFVVLAAFPETLGACQYVLHRMRRQRGTLIEYK